MMNFELTEEHLAVQQAARDFAQTELLPGVSERDEHQKFPAEQIKKMGELGFMGMMVDPKYGGGGMDTISYVLAMEEISKIDASASVCMSVNNSLVCWGIETFGNEDQKQKYLELGSTWWWESNRMIPINIFLKQDWNDFRFTLRTFNNRELIIAHGPVCSLMNIGAKKSKRRSITLVRKLT